MDIRLYMAKKQTRRSVSISKATYERLKAYCETNAISMSEFVELRLGDYFGRPRKAVGPAEADAAKKVADHIFTF